MTYEQYLIKWLQNQIKQTKKRGFVVGISGGIDSALVGALIKKAMPNHSLGVIMPIEDMNDYEDAQMVVKHLDLTTQVVDLTNTFTQITKALNVLSQSSLINIKPRLRMTALYALAQELNYLVVGTDNADEWLLGYFTKYGDGGVDLLPIVHLAKSEVRKMAKSLNIPDQIINKVPSAGLFPGQTDEQELGFSYEMVDKYLTNQPIPNDIKQKIILQHNNTTHKRVPILTPLHPQKF